MSGTHFDVLIIGAGISGISAAYYLQKDCPNKTYAILEGRKNIGGTWDLFKYPGIRSDSDMYTFGFKFHPWTNPKSVASGASIMDYLKETVDIYGIHKHIHFDQQILEARWSSTKARWSLSTKSNESGKTSIYTCNFLSMCTGYYNYEKGYTPKFPEIHTFKGQVIHPQNWNKQISYDNKQIIVIGSGATAVTLVPELAKRARQVIMLQRSPTYIVSLPDEDIIATFFNKNLPLKLAYKINRWKNILFSQFFYWLNRTYPKIMKKRLINGVRQQLGEEYEIEKHFTPNYKPWDQRVCLATNGDLFEAIKK